MKIDRANRFSSAQVLTSGATTTLASTDYIDQGPLATGNLYRQLGASDLYLVTIVETTATSTGSATLSVKVTTDNNTGFTSTALVLTQISALAVASVTAGTMYVSPLPRTGVDYERYLRTEYTMGTAPFSAGGNITSFLTTEPGYWYAYAKNAQESNTF